VLLWVQLIKQRFQSRFSLFRAQSLFEIFQCRKSIVYNMPDNVETCNGQALPSRRIECLILEG
jgi:hypothetical protein